MTLEKSTACVIGAGIGGVAAALRLAAKNYDVVVFEKSPDPGGKISSFKQLGYRFDMGPSLFTLPGMVDELFELYGKSREDYLKFIDLDITCNYFFSDGNNLKAWSDKHRFLKEINKFGADCEPVKQFLEKQQFLYNYTSDFFLFSSIHKLATFTSDAGKRSLKALHRLDAFSTMHHRNVKEFGDPNLVQLFDRYATYNGSDPYRAPATLNMIAHLEHNTGAYFPENGMYGILEALVKLAKESGIRFVYNMEVLGLITKGREVTGVRTIDCVYPASLVVNNTDITAFYRDILKEPYRYRRLMKKERSSSALIFYWGMKTRSDLDVHNILFSSDYRAEFEGLFKKKMLADDLTVYIFISSKVVKNDAPEGCENWYVMINAPENIGQDWDEETSRARRIILKKIKEMLGMDAESAIETERIMTPVEIESRTGSVNGSLYGHASNSVLSAFMRHPNFSRKYQNLYFAGGSVHPGGGIPLCLASAKIVDELIEGRD